MHIQIVNIANDSQFVISNITDKIIHYQVYNNGNPIEDKKVSAYTIENGKCSFDNRFIDEKYFKHLMEQRL
jgi:hypothetical protein